LTLNDTPEFVGFVSGGEWVSRVNGKRLYYNSKTTTSLAGKYTLALLNTNAASWVANGNGYAVLTIKANGNVVLRGKLADDESFSQSCGLSRTGEIAFYAAPYKGLGRVFGWLQFTNEETNSIRGPQVYWLRNEDSTLPYPEGFSLVLSAFGSTYTQPITTPVLGFTNGVASFYAGDLFSDETATWQFAKVLLRPPATFRPLQEADKVDLKVNKKTGVLSGGFRNVMTGERAPIKGVVLQKQNLAQGFFLSSGASGAFSLVPGTSVP
jgi:hypothetical protein